jgi:hypothetical protein
MTAGVFGMDITGFEPVTPTMSTWCSNQLSYMSNVFQYNTIG